MPKIPDMTNWQQAELLMQPAYIRVNDHLRKQLEQSVWQGKDPDANSYPGRYFCLYHAEQQVMVDLWELCYQICFLDYSPELDIDGTQEVQIDAKLLDEDGEVDWQFLDTKAERLVTGIFANLV
jgi:hypothetical protein